MGQIVKCVAQSGFNIRCLLSSRRPCSTSSFLDIHAVVKGLEAEGIPSNQSEAIAKLLNETFVSKSDIHKSAELLDAQLSALKWEMKSLPSAGLSDKQLSALKWEMKYIQSAGLSDKQLSALKWEMKSIQDNQLLALQQEQLKMQKELKLKLEKLDMGIEMKHAKLVAHQEARMLELANDSDKDNQLLALQQEQLKMQKKLELKLEKLDMGIEMKHAKLVARQEARMLELANDSDKGFYELNDRINATDAKWTAALEGIKTQIEGARYDVIKYCIGAFMFGGFVVGVMTHAYDAIKY